MSKLTSLSDEETFRTQLLTYVTALAPDRAINSLYQEEITQIIQRLSRTNLRQLRAVHEVYDMELVIHTLQSLRMEYPWRSISAEMSYTREVMERLVQRSIESLNSMRKPIFHTPIPTPGWLSPEGLAQHEAAEQKLRQQQNAREYARFEETGHGIPRPSDSDRRGGDLRAGAPNLRAGHTLDEETHIPMVQAEGGKNHVLLGRLHPTSMHDKGGDHASLDSISRHTESLCLGHFVEDELSGRVFIPADISEILALRLIGGTARPNDPVDLLTTDHRAMAVAGWVHSSVELLLAHIDGVLCELGGVSNPPEILRALKDGCADLRRMVAAQIAAQATKEFGDANVASPADGEQLTAALLQCGWITPESMGGYTPQGFGTAVMHHLVGHAAANQPALNAIMQRIAKLKTSPKLRAAHDTRPQGVRIPDVVPPETAQPKPVTAKVLRFQPSDAGSVRDNGTPQAMPMTNPRPANRQAPPQAPAQPDMIAEVAQAEARERVEAPAAPTVPVSVAPNPVREALAGLSAMALLRDSAAANKAASAPPQTPVSTAMPPVISAREPGAAPERTSVSVPAAPSEQQQQTTVQVASPPRQGAVAQATQPPTTAAAAPIAAPVPAPAQAPTPAPSPAPAPTAQNPAEEQLPFLLDSTYTAAARGVLTPEELNAFAIAIRTGGDPVQTVTSPVGTPCGITPSVPQLVASPTQDEAGNVRLTVRMIDLPIEIAVKLNDLVNQEVRTWPNAQNVTLSEAFTGVYAEEWLVSVANDLGLYLSVQIPEHARRMDAEWYIVSENTQQALPLIMRPHGNLASDVLLQRLQARS